MLKFSKANAKLRNLYSVESLYPYLHGDRKVYSYDSGLSGWTCPGAKDCLAKVIIENGRRKVKDGNEMKFRCFSASQEALFPAVYNQRQANFDYLNSFDNLWDMATGIVNSIPNDAGIIRINVAGDIFSQKYFDAIIVVANSCPGVLFYAYTKSLNFWVNRLSDIPENLVLTASYGGRYDYLIDMYNLRYVKVIADSLSSQTNTLPIDHNDSLAARPDIRNEHFALLLHGVQAAGSVASSFLKELNGKGSYSR